MTERRYQLQYWSAVTDQWRLTLTIFDDEIEARQALARKLGRSNPKQWRLMVQDCTPWVEVQVGDTT